MRRAAVIVLDACGVGALPDAGAYAGDEGSNTLAHLAERVGGLDLPALQRLGLGSILPLLGVPPAPEPVLHGRLAPLGPGKESTTGHWELMGVVPAHPLPTYPRGFPPDVVELLEGATGRRFCCNRPFSGTEVLEAYGEHHLETGELILYTSADSVLQLAAHVEVLDEPGLYAVCEAAREVMDGEHRVGRVIARPFDGSPGQWHRREGRRDSAA
jgi:phosphopentomutase